jgi:hypothetical protein
VGIQLPEEHVLIALLGEPRVADIGVPWIYNRLTFEVQREKDAVEVMASPGYGDMLIRWRREGESIVTLQLADVDALRVETEHGREYLVARFKGESRLRDLRLQVSPSVSILWGTES